MGLFDSFWHRLLRRPYKLDFLEAGEGKRTVVLLHGLAADKDVWRRLIEELSPDAWHIVAPDLMGFGASPKPQWNNYTVEEHARMVLALLRRLDIKGPVVLVGHSMGCLVAAHIAATKPKLVSRLVLHEPPLLGDMPEFPEHTKRSERYKALFEYIASHPQLAHLENKIMWRLARKVSGLYLSPEEWLPFERSLRNTILGQRAYDELNAVSMPTDIVYGNLDLIVIRRGIQELFQSNKNIKLHLVTDTHGISARSARYLAGLLKGREVRVHKKRRRKSARQTRP
ncbi:MAG TPA: alpha/beta hydrolase [Candidatus Saccharimonadales bacterium]